MGRRKRDDEITQRTQKVRIDLCTTFSGLAKSIQHMPRNEVAVLQVRLQLGDCWGQLRMPREWVPPGTSRAHAARCFSICKLSGVAANDQPTADNLILTITRLALICFLIPVEKMGRGGLLLSPSTLATNYRRFCYIAREALAAPAIGSEGIFERLNRRALEKICADNGLRTEMNRLLALTERGYWHDLPNCRELWSGIIQEQNALRNARGVSKKHDGLSGVREERGTNRSSGRFQPFKDEFVSELGWRVAWYIKMFEPALIDCLEKAQAYTSVITMPRPGAKRERKIAAGRRRYHVKSFLSTYRWIDSDGQEITQLPFAMRLGAPGPGHSRESTPFCWPPRTLFELVRLASIAQTVHLCVLLFSMGGRISEVLSIKLGVQLSREGEDTLIDGRTYKPFFAKEGGSRDWPLPEIGRLAVDRQHQLTSALRRWDPLVANAVIDERNQATTGCLWGVVESGQPIDSAYNELLRAVVQTFDLTAVMGGMDIHAHRFRITVARLIALSVVGAPKVIMDFFGHETIEMTMHYILKDPFIRAEIEDVARAQVVMLAKDAIVEIDLCGGPAAPRLRQAVWDTKVRIGHDFGEDDLSQLADVLTLSGTHWQLVRPGVICTKMPDQVGACNGRRGKPEPAGCRSYCLHRLEMSALRDDVDRSISEAFANLKRSVKSDDPIGAEMWRGQIMANLTRFPDIKEKWSKRRNFRRLMSEDGGAL